MFIALRSHGRYMNREKAWLEEVGVKADTMTMGDK